MELRRWNHKLKAYQPYTPDPSWTIVLYTPDLGLKINCTSCGFRMTYGEGFTSREVHNPFGLGYPVCGACYDDELDRERRSKEDHD